MPEEEDAYKKTGNVDLIVFVHACMFVFILLGSVETPYQALNKTEAAYKDLLHVNLIDLLLLHG